MPHRDHCGGCNRPEEKRHPQVGRKGGNLRSKGFSEQWKGKLIPSSTQTRRWGGVGVLQREVVVLALIEEGMKIQGELLVLAEVGAEYA